MQGWFIERDDFRAARRPARPRRPARAARPDPRALRKAARAQRQGARSAGGRGQAQIGVSARFRSAGQSEAAAAGLLRRPAVPAAPADLRRLRRRRDRRDLRQRRPARAAARPRASFSTASLRAPCFIVVRGAVEIRARHAKRERRMAVLGPGQLLGYMSALEKGVARLRRRGARGGAAAGNSRARTSRSSTSAASPASTKLRRAIQGTLAALARPDQPASDAAHFARRGFAARTRKAKRWNGVLASQIVWALDEANRGLGSRPRAGSC